MALIIKPIRPDVEDFAAEVTGVDIAKGVSSGVAAEIEAGIDKYAVLVFRDQVINEDQQYAFSEHFGPMEAATGDIAKVEDRRLSLKINDISNLDQKGNVLARDDRRRQFSFGNMLWHSDSSFKPTPAKFSLLAAHVVPSEGADTQFADMRAAWDALDDKSKEECRDLICDHSQLYSRGKLGFTDFSEEERERWTPVPQRLVRRHPNTGRLSLYLSAHIGTIQGWPIPEARLFLFDLTEHATRPEFVYAHKWRERDLVMWDNRVLMHRGRRFDDTQIRDMRRTTVADRAPTLEQAI